MYLLIALLLLAAAAILWLRSPPRGSSARLPRASGAKPARFRYRAVSISGGDNACPAALRLAGQRHLLGQAPILPLPECDRDRCNCTYSHHPDRRDPGDRRELQQLDEGLTEHNKGPEHRHNRGRRRIDYA